MKKISIILLLILILVSCGKNIGNKIMKSKDGSVTIQIPDNWKLENDQFCYKNDFETGTLIEEHINNNFEDMVNAISTDFGTQIISREHFNINGYHAIKDILKSTDGTYAITVYIEKGDTLIEITYATESESAYLKIENSIKKSIASIKIE